MEHVAQHHGQGISEYVRVPCQLAILEKQLEPPQTFEDFWAFPAKCGWQIREKDYQIEPELPKTTLAGFLQSWLFFGLAFTVVQIEGKPSLALEDLVMSTYLTTVLLNQKLHEWGNWEKAHLDGLRFRMIQVDWVLDYARQVVRKNCAYIGNAVGYDHDEDSEIHMDDKHVLVLMCLGETLSEAKASIMASEDLRDLKVKLDGWHADDHAGWGPPRYVLHGMEKGGWCKRAIQLLKGQLKSNATMLMSAFWVHSSFRLQNEDHRLCTPEECKFKHTNGSPGTYSGHIGDCRGCESLGPTQDTILEILRERRDIIPLLRFLTADGPPTLDVGHLDRADLSTKKPDFVTISHVWSDGWGNKEKNELSTCRLKYIRRQIARATKTPTSWFWMDTLVVPVGPAVDIQPDLKKKAIRQIFQVFNQSNLTIVLDNGLKAMNRGNPVNPAEAAMRILSSVWMRRLWTLQEAYLSRQILISFEEGNGCMNQLGLDDLENELNNSILSLPTSGIIKLVRDQLSYFMLGQERRDRRNMSESEDHWKTSPRRTAALIANIWRAARWRSIDNPEHEMLALATFLNLKFKDTGIEKAALSDPIKSKGYQDVKRREDLAVQLWTLLDHDFRGSIPSGMIFLPGPKINRQGFGWAPRTWLSPYELDYPDPLRVWKQATVLSQDGLQVQYPGFLLYPDSPKMRGRILGTIVETDPTGNALNFSFPIDRNFSQWYSFRKPADEKPSDQLQRLETAQSTLAIILSDSQPKELSEEIALLVEIEKSWNGGSMQQPAYCTRIIHRIMIWKEEYHLHTREDRSRYRKGFFLGCHEQSVCLGEVVDPSQLWWVDGFVTEDIISEEGLADGDGQEDQNDISETDVAADIQRSDRGWSVFGWGNAFP